MQNGRKVYLIDGCRTPFLKARGAPGAFSAADLAVACGRPLLARQSFLPSALDEVILGCVAADADEANIARIAALRIGCGDKVPAWTVARNCASGMQAVDSAAIDIACGRAELVLAGGVEAMSRAPLLFSRAFVAWLATWQRANWRGKLRALGQLSPSSLAPVIGLLKGLTDPVVGLSMGQTAEKIAHRFDITREAMDAFAVRSHERLASAIDAGILADEITPIVDTGGKAYTDDGGLRRNTGIDDLAKLRPVFDRPVGKITAGNSAQITDGCAWLLLASERAVAKYNLRARAEIIDCNWAALDPAQMGLGPVHAVTPMLQRNRIARDDIDYWEINEAFAAQVLACLAAWRDDDYCRDELNLPRAFGELDESHLNLHGGGVSLGHPVGASGARIVLHALHTLEQHHWQRAVATLCIGGGQGGAMLIERIETSATRRGDSQSDSHVESKSDSRSDSQTDEVRAHSICKRMNRFEHRFEHCRMRHCLHCVQCIGNAAQSHQPINTSTASIE